MPNEYARDIQKVHDFESLVDFLRDTLCWPIPNNRETFEDITFYWSAGDLDLDPDTQARIIGCWQLRLFDLRFLGSQDPWGIFFIQFKNDVAIDFSSTLLRRVLRGLVERNNRDTSLPFWKRDRILFICVTLDFQDRSFAYFEGMRSYPIFHHYPPLIYFKLDT